MKKVILSQLILITSILISCTDKLENTEVNNNPTNQVVLTSNEYASIAYDNPKELSEDEITTSNPQLSSSASFLRLNVLSSLN